MSRLARTRRSRRRGRAHATRGRGAQLIAAGRSKNEIADKLVLSNATVKTHINRIFYKTGARDRAQAVRYAYHHGIADPH